ncbi:MAG: ABC transporter permease [Hyphomicrobiales bacterium]|nr:ABC transporter permease [Hyphomicrobiales bacterium]
MTLVSLAWRNLGTNKLRTFATVVGIVLAVASFVALVGLARGVEATLRASLEVRGTDVIVTESGAVDPMSSVVSDRLAEAIAQEPGVAAASVELTRMTSLESGASVIVVSWPMDAFPWQTLEIHDGRLPVPTDERPALIGGSLAERLGLAVGDEIVLFQTAFPIVGTIESTSVLTRNLAFIPLADAQELTFREGQATSVNVWLDPSATKQGKETTIAALRRDFHGYAIETTEKFAADYTFARFADVLSLSISTVALISAIFAILNTMSMSVNEKRGEIAIMSAIGWTRRRIILLILLEGTILSLAAGLLGIVVGVAVAYSVALSPTIAGFIAPEIRPGLLIQAAAITLAIGLIGSLIPAARTAAMAPAEVLRGR